MHATIHGERTLTDLDSILAITDFSATTDAVLSRAAQLAAEHGATLKLMYAAPGGDLPCPDAACRLSHHALQLGQRHEISIRTVSRTSNTDEDVASAARCADLVVAGVSRERSLLSFLRGQPVERPPPCVGSNGTRGQCDHWVGDVALARLFGEWSMAERLIQSLES